MKITKTYVLLTIIAVLTVIYIASQILQFDVIANTARSLVLPFAYILYHVKAYHKSLYFSGFLFIFSLSELMGLLIFKIDGMYMFYIGNSLYILGYIFLILEILSRIKSSKFYKSFFTKYAIYITVMVIVDAYLIVLLGDIVRSELDNKEYALAMVYNSVILILLSVALLNFFCSYTKRSLVLFLASLCIVFSEIVQMAYFYLVESNSLNIILSILLVMAFYLFVKQAFIEKHSDQTLLAPV